MSVHVVDLRRVGGPAWPKTRVRGGRSVMRAPHVVDALCLHQTATRLPPGDRLVERYGDLAPAWRAHRVGAHVVAMRCGIVAATRPLRAYVNGAGPLNARVISIEVEGRFPGLVDDPATAPREDLLTTWGLRPGHDPDDLDELTAAAACAAVDFALEEAAREGMRIRYVFAHRQSSASRRSDPGEALWERVAVEHCGRRGLERVPEFTVGSGRPLPAAWDPEADAAY